MRGCQPRVPRSPWPPLQRESESVTLPAARRESAIRQESRTDDESRIRLFLMTNSFETGGSERQFSVLAQNLRPEQFHVHLGCIQRIGPFASLFGDVPEFWLGRNLYGLKSWRTRLRLSGELRRERIQIAHAFDFYTNLTLIPAARFGRGPGVMGRPGRVGDLLTRNQFRAQAAVLRWCDAVVCNSQAGAARLPPGGVSRGKSLFICNVSI